jgi:hypothetical protein
MRQSMVELDPAARYPRMILAAHLKWGLVRQHLSWLRHFSLGAENRAGHDQRLRPSPAFGQSAGDQ